MLSQIQLNARQKTLLLVFHDNSCCQSASLGIKKMLCSYKGYSYFPIQDQLSPSLEHLSVSQFKNKKKKLCYYNSYSSFPIQDQSFPYLKQFPTSQFKNKKNVMSCHKGYSYFPIQNQLSPLSRAASNQSV